MNDDCNCEYCKDTRNGENSSDDDEEEEEKKEKNYTLEKQRKAIIYIT